MYLIVQKLKKEKLFIQLYKCIYTNHKLINVKIKSHPLPTLMSL